MDDIFDFMRRTWNIPDYVLQKRVAKTHVFEMDHKHDNTACWFILIKAQSSTNRVIASRIFRSVNYQMSKISLFFNA